MPENQNISRTQQRAGIAVSGFAVLFFLFDGGMKLFKLPPAVTTTVGLGYQESMIVGIGIALLAGTALYVLPRTAVLGAIVLTAFLGGAAASNIRAQTLCSMQCFP